MAKSDEPRLALGFTCNATLLQSCGDDVKLGEVGGQVSTLAWADERGGGGAMGWTVCAIGGLMGKDKARRYLRRSTACEHSVEDYMSTVDSYEGGHGKKAKDMYDGVSISRWPCIWNELFVIGLLSVYGIAFKELRSS